VCHEPTEHTAMRRFGYFGALLGGKLSMIWAVGIEHKVWFISFPEWLGTGISLATGVLIAHLFRAVGGMAVVRSRSVTEIAGAPHSPSILSTGAFHGQGCSVCSIRSDIYMKSFHVFQAFDGPFMFHLQRF
jgi:hypothetical protein